MKNIAAIIISIKLSSNFYNIYYYNISNKDLIYTELSIFCLVIIIFIIIIGVMPTFLFTSFLATFQVKDISAYGPTQPPVSDLVPIRALDSKLCKKLDKKPYQSFTLTHCFIPDMGKTGI